MKRLLVFAIIFLLAFTARAAEIRGAWTATLASSGQKMHVQLTYGGDRHHNTWGRSFELGDLIGLAPSQLDHTDMTSFRIAGDAGTVVFRGTFEGGEGAGHFVFTPDPSFYSKLDAIGVPHENRVPEDDELLSATLSGVTVDFITTMRSEGYNLSLDKYTSMRIFGVTRAVIDEYRHLGYDHIPADQLIAMRIHGVTADYIRQMREAGYRDATIDDLVSTRIHGATPEFINDMHALGYDHLTLDRAVEFRIHGVSPAMVRELRELGYDRIPADDLVSMRIHGATPQFVRELRELGYDHVPVDDLVSMRIHGVTPDFIRKVNAAGYRNVPPEKLVAMRIHGIDAKFLEKMSHER